MPKSCKPRPTIYFAASSCSSREGVSTGRQRHSGPATSLPAAGGPELPQQFGSSAHRDRLCPSEALGVAANRLGGQ